MRRSRASLAALLAIAFAASTPGSAIAAPPAPPAGSKKAPAVVEEDGRAIPKEANDMEARAVEALKSGDPEGALKHAKSALAFLERRLGADHFEVGMALMLISEIHFARKDPPSAEAPAKRAVQIFERTEAKNVPELVRSLSIVAAVYESRGQEKAALPLRARGAEILERALGIEHPEVIRGYRILATIYQRNGEDAKALAVYKRVLGALERVKDAKPGDIADVLSGIGMTNYGIADYDAADAAFRRALEVRKSMPDADPIDIGELSNNLAEVAFARGDYPTAEPLYKEALAILEKALGPEEGSVGVVLGNLGCIELERGDFDKAIPHLTRSLEIREKSHGPDNIYVAAARSNLAEAYMRSGNIAAAAPLIESAFETRKKFLAPDHPLLATAIHDLGSLRSDQGRYDEAKQLLTQAIAIREKALGKDHPAVAEALYNLGMTRFDLAEYKEAAAAFERVIDIREKTFGARHHDLAPALEALSTVRWSAGEKDAALRDLTRAADIAERHAGLVLTAGSEEERVAYLSTLTPLVRTVVARSVEGKGPAWVDLGLTAVLRQKGRALDAVADSVGALRRTLSPDARALMDQLREAQKRLAALAIRGKTDDPASIRAEIAKEEATIDKLEAEISAKSASYRVLGEPVTVDQVRAALPEGSALCEVIANAALPARGAEAPPTHYIAYILRREGAVVVRDLGETQAIDDQVKALRRALMSPDSTDVKALGRSLDERIMKPLREALGGLRTVFLSPDGQLNLIPFEALVDENDHYLVDSYSFTYLTSGRDLLRKALRRPSRSGPVVIANPDFGATGRAESAAPSGSPSVPASLSRGVGIGDLSRVRFTPLPATAVEGKAIGSELHGALLREGAEADKASLLKVAGPRILHVATHGFFLGAPGSSGPDGGRGLTLENGTTPTIAPMTQNPLLRSGIALVGANKPGAEKASGILTALEASSLDLDGTKLVALSACETGVGEVRAGEGVYGLRRALVIAGAETVLMSLWKVDDEATRDLMVSYYHRIEAGEGRSEALRAVRLTMMGEEGRAHPFYWASFIVSGDPSTIEGTQAPTLGVVHPSARGCACRFEADSASTTSGAWAGLVLALSFAIRRRATSVCR